MGLIASVTKKGNVNFTTRIPSSLKNHANFRPLAQSINKDCARINITRNQCLLLRRLAPVNSSNINLKTLSLALVKSKTRIKATRMADYNLKAKAFGAVISAPLLMKK